MKSLFRPAISVLLVMTALTGLAYPLAVTGLGNLLFPRQAQGSLVEKNGVLVGSALIGQNFADPRHFWGRPSASAPQPYNAQASGGSNTGPSNPALLDAVKGRIDALRQADPGNKQAIPVDLVAASGSGLDPEISPAAAEYQVTRVARARGLSDEAVRELVRRHTSGRQWGFLGESRVNVLALNMELDAKP